ncbi:MAG TPA: chitobiase/beta-hexosaminidase C-terminal domain-containing protein [Puia sp.]|nr:chitobiase/beta-hexosaminidase C-terminal domain-containing protein [Puia sp.]
MNRWKNVVFTVTFAANCLLCFLLFFESRLVIPTWLQVVGRMHPLVLHFPLVLLILFILLTLLRRPDTGLLLLAALTAVLTAIMGLFLSKEPGYDPETIFWHKWGGVLLAFGSFAWYGWYEPLQKIKFASAGACVVCLVLLFFTGHEGAGITHGANFLLAPVRPEAAKKRVALEDAVVFTDMVQPILQNKCMGCHNSNKAKGELIMETSQLLLKGGKTGPVWDSTRPDLGLLLQRIHLSPEEEKHMPPRGKPQLTETEVSILYQWLKHDPTLSIRVADLGPTDTLRQLAATLFKGPAEEDIYDFDAADEKTVQQLNTSYRIVSPLALHSPALSVDFYSPQFFKSSQLKELEPLNRQIVALNLDKMPLTDADIPTIARFSNLRVLNLSFTGVTGAGIAGLKTLEKLKSLSLSGTAIKAEDLATLSSLKSLRRLYVWNTAIAPGTIRNTNGSLRIEGGSRTDTMLLKLNPPILQNEESILREPIDLRLKHYVPGVTIRYTVDGSEPDSSHSLLYTAGQVRLTERTDFSARAFKKGWLPSDVIHTYFYSEKFRPDSVRMLQPIDSNYMKYGGRTLIDLTKGDLNFNSGKWLGFRKNKMECLLLFDKPIVASDVTLSAQVNVGASIMPPVSIEVWGGAGPGALRPLARLVPDTARAPGSAYLTPYDLSFHPVKVSCIKVVVTPVAKLPEWHGEKGKKGWVFVDEIFVN